jgi:alpha-tubulin suppressor-like RCC1 family protein
VAGGMSSTCALDEAGALFCWGLNEDRQLGIADIDFVGVPTRVDVDAPGGWRELGLGEHHACAIRADRTLWCWGRNRDGQIGIGSATEAPVAQPTRVCF